MLVKHKGLSNISICYLQEIVNNKFMSINENNYNNILQNLKDADCDSNLIKKFFELDKDNNTKEQLKLLAKHRRELLNLLHLSQKKIDCLDFLIFNLKQQ